MTATPPSGSNAFPRGLLDFLDPAQGRRASLGGCDPRPEGLECFNRALHRLSPQSPAMTIEQISNAARRALARHRDGATPPFVQSRMAALQRLELLAADPTWGAETVVQRQVAILRQYRQETGDLIPDPLPVIGLLDDAVLVEVGLQLLRAELAIYEDFCRFRAIAADFIGLEEAATGLTRDHWLAAMMQWPVGIETPCRTPDVPDPRAILFQIT